MRCAFEVAPIDLGEQLPVVRVLNAEREMCMQRRYELHDELQRVECRLENAEHRLDNIHEPIAGSGAGAHHGFHVERRQLPASEQRQSPLLDTGDEPTLHRSTVTVRDGLLQQKHGSFSSYGC